MNEVNTQGKILDKEIIKAFIGGSEEAFSQMYQFYFNRILYFAYTYVGSMDTAKDVVQNTFLAAYRSKDKLQHIEAFHSWLMKIAYRECQNSFRKAKIKQSDLSDELDEMVDEKNPTIKDHLEDVVLQEVVNKEIECMNHKLKDVAILKYLEGFSEKEISYILKIPKGTVKSRASRAKTILQERLSKRGITPATYKTYGYTFPMLFAGAYSYMQAQLPASDFGALIDNTKKVVTSGGILSGITLTFAQKTMVATVAVASIVTATVALNTQKSVALGTYQVNEKSVPEAEPAKIEGVEYNQAYTNQPINVEVGLSNDNYDEILINGSTSTTIEGNGDYLIQVKYQGEVIAEQMIHIANIDTERPAFLYYQDTNNVYTIYMKDDVSKIDFENIKYYKDEVLSKDFTFDPVAQTIQFVYEQGSYNLFNVSDNAGNVTDVTVK